MLASAYYYAISQYALLTNEKNDHSLRRDTPTKTVTRRLTLALKTSFDGIHSLKDCWYIIFIFSQEVQIFLDFSSMSMSFDLSFKWKNTIA